MEIPGEAAAAGGERTGYPARSDRKVPAQPERGIWRRPRAAAGGELRGQLTGRNPAMCVPASSPSPAERARPRAPFLPAQGRQLRREAGEGVGEGAQRRDT